VNTDHGTDQVFLKIEATGWIQMLIGGLEHEFYEFPQIGNVIIPTDEVIFFRGVGIPTRYKGLDPACLALGCASRGEGFVSSNGIVRCRGNSI